MKIFTLIVCLHFSFIGLSQEIEDLPYYELPAYADQFTAGTMAARMVDALGFRYFWATESLNETDLIFRPSDEVRSTEETIDHILDLSFVIVNSTIHQTNGKNDVSTLSFADKRKQTLINLKTAADILRTSDDISQFKIIFGDREIPFWNQVNGPIADAIWHCGQISSNRRTSGNPINSKINFMMGTVDAK